MPVSPTADKRFRRSHVSPARRNWLRRSWKRIAGVAVGTLLVIYLIAAMAAYAVSSSWLTVDRIIVHGNSRISAGEVHALLEGAIGASMVTADLDVWRQRLLTSPWVAHAELRREFPDAVSVTLVERTAAAIGRVDGTMYLVDRSGAVIDEYGPRYAELDLPIVDGMGTGRTGAFLVDPMRARLVSRLLASLEPRPELLERVSEIDVSNPRDVTVVLSGDTTLLRLGRDHFADRLQAYVDLAPRLRERVPEIDTVDLRYDTRVYVQGSRRAAGRKG